ncbi:winged helix family two component transcriptional regulator [Limnobacter thiooxidans]|uniref:Response regulator n=1 Tax=Limnobacter thiooxidans TaxID=131080 RepID=A0AA86J8L8_9BURK|nr:response regulator transcription factor [Limnobacter sp.]MCZ8014392.1 response regulator transcription factor [Limnobacter sp.]RZS41973.1 winged helix family two component transcriptional regulator [Limnobacter thiooxidans]BET26595.1 response regulator [Limnobacter thiooxidans]
MRVLLVEDDELIANGVREALRRRAYQVDWINNGRDALNAALDNPFDLIILDLGLPGMDGLEVLGKLRAQHRLTPTIILSARGTTQNRIDGLNVGADDYLVKPFELEELFARIHAIERRTSGSATNVLRMGQIELDLAGLRVIYNGQEVTLQRREFSLLKKLMENPRQVFTREQLEESLYGWTSDLGSNAIDVYVHNIRKKLYSDVIKTLRGVGYRIDPNLSGQ